MSDDDKAQHISEVEDTPDAGSLKPKGKAELGKAPGNAHTEAQPDEPVRNDEIQKA